MQRTYHSQNDFSKNNIGMLTLPDFKTSKATIIKILWYRESRIDSHMWLIDFQQMYKGYLESILFSTNSAGTIGCPNAKY